MSRARKLALIFTSLILLLASLCQVAAAIEVSPRASLYLDGYGAYLYQGSSRGSIFVDFTVSATRRSDCVGVSNISIYKEDGTLVSSVKGTLANGLLGADKKTYSSDYTYYGEAGTVYYMVLTMYAENDGGSDYRLYTTNNCRGPS